MTAQEDVDELVAAAPALLAGHEPLTALGCWFDRVAGYARIKRGVFAAVEAGARHLLQVILDGQRHLPAAAWLASVCDTDLPARIRAALPGRPGPVRIEFTPH